MTPGKARVFTTTIYNPALLKKDDLIRGFVARQPLLDRLLGDLRRETPGSTPQHQIIIGQRGHGKTTLLRRLAFAVEDDPALAAEWIPLVFPEEQYNVAKLTDFWLNCVDALSDALDNSGDSASAEALDARVKTVSGADAALRLLLDEADRLNRRVLLLVDNIDIVLDRLRDTEEWEFRRIISAEKRLHFIGASSRALESLYEHGRAFFDFFQIHELKGFDEQETFSTLAHLAEQSGDAEVAKLVRERPARIKALRVLTGGNPRTLVLLYKVLSQGPDGDVQHDIEQLLDEYTALYKARFEELAPQAQQVVDAMAIHWDPLTAADLTELLKPLGVNQVSAQLKRLEDFGVVEKTPWFGEKKNAFQIAERFFNIWYLMRASRRVRRRLLWLVRFLESWFDREELSTQARGFLDRDPAKMGRERFADLALVYSQAVPDRHLRLSLESAGLHAVVDEGVDRLIDFSDLPAELQDKKDRMEQLRDLRRQVCSLQIDWGGIDPVEFWRLLGGTPQYSLAEKARMVGQLTALPPGRLAELHGKLLRSEQRSLTMYRGREKDVQHLYLALSRGEMADVYDYENAIAVAKRYGLLWLPYIGIQSRIGSWFNGEDLSDTELAKADEVLRCMTLEPGFESLAWNGLGNLFMLRRRDSVEAERAYRKAIEADPVSPIPWNELGIMFQQSPELYEEAERAYRKSIELDDEYARTWSNLGNLLRDLDRVEEAENAYGRAIELDPENPGHWFNWGNLLQVNLKRFNESRRAYQRAIELDPYVSEPWNNLGVLLMDGLQLGEEAEPALRRSIELNGTSAVPWSNLGRLLERLPVRVREAAEAFLRAFELDPLLSWNLADFLRTCDQLATQTADLTPTLKLLERARELAPNSIETQFCHARFLTLVNRWPEATQLLEQLATDESANVSNGLFHAAIQTGHLEETIAILERTGANDRWLPLYQALRAARAGTPAYLRTVAPEVRTVATEILREIAPHLFEVTA